MQSFSSMSWADWKATLFGSKATPPAPRQRRPVAGRKPTTWVCRDGGSGKILLETQALTKSEARADFRRRLGFKRRLPEGFLVTQKQPV